MNTSEPYLRKILLIGHSHKLRHCIEPESRYLLLVKWETLEDQTEGFRGPDEYQQWRDLLHHFYDPFPAVEHYSLGELSESE